MSADATELLSDDEIAKRDLTIRHLEKVVDSTSRDIALQKACLEKISLMLVGKLRDTSIERTAEMTKRGIVHYCTRKLYAQQFPALEIDKYLASMKLDAYISRGNVEGVTVRMFNNHINRYVYVDIPDDAYMESSLPGTVILLEYMQRKGYLTVHHKLY